MGIKKHIPNAITCCNLLCGCLAVVLSATPYTALMFVLLAAVFDFFDGFAARTLKAYSPIGKDLDSLADMVSFGVAPAFVGLNYALGLVHKAFGYVVPEMQPAMQVQTERTILSLSSWMIALYVVALALPLFIAVFSALRLAKFNNDTRQSENFIGFATPACAILYISLIDFLYETLVVSFTEFNAGVTASNPALCWYYWLPVIIVPLLCWLLVSEIPMFSMKIKNLSWQDNRTRFIFVMIVAVEIAMTIIGGYSISVFLCAVITTYILVNILMLAFKRK